MQTWTPCARCGNDNHDAERESMDLFGGYAVVLCHPCQNAWSEALMGHRCWQDQREIEARKAHLVGRAHSGDAPSLEEWRGLTVAENAVKDAAFRFATEWVAAGVPAAEPAPAKS